jgi:hypothetical protein
MFSNYRFPYSYLVTTSFQSKPHLRDLPENDLTKVNHISHLRQNPFRNVTGGLYGFKVQIHRNFADLRLLAITTSYFQVAENNLYVGIFRFFITKI